MYLGFIAWPDLVDGRAFFLSRNKAASFSREEVSNRKKLEEIMHTNKVVIFKVIALFLIFFQLLSPEGKSASYTSSSSYTGCIEKEGKTTKEETRGVLRIWNKFISVPQKGPSVQV